MDKPQQRTIRIGKSQVGIMGLEAAFRLVRSKGDLSADEAADLLFETIRKQNYIPAGAEDIYRQGLLQAYRDQQQGTLGTGQLTIRILGRPCVSCNKLKAMVIDILQEMELAADIEDIHDLDEIWRYGVTKTPALLINGEVKSAGSQPPRFQVKQWLSQAAGK
jgi:hypothetical protein